MTNPAAYLARLGENAAAFAKCYVALVEALMAEGVDEDTARRDARQTAALIAVSEVDDEAACPLCGQ